MDWMRGEVEPCTPLPRPGDGLLRRAPASASAGRGCRGLPGCVSRWVRCASGLCWVTLACTALLMVGGISGAAAEERGGGWQGCSWHYNDLHWNLDPLVRFRPASDYT